MAIYLTVEWGTLKMDLARVVDAWCLQVMDLPDPGFFLHGRQLPLGWPQHHGPPWGGAGARLAGSRGSEGGVDRAGGGTPFIGISPAHGF